VYPSRLLAPILARLEAQAAGSGRPGAEPEQARAKPRLPWWKRLLFG
jgi:hypothetical protein